MGLNRPVGFLLSVLLYAAGLGAFILSAVSGTAAVIVARLQLVGCYSHQNGRCGWRVTPQAVRSHLNDRRAVTGTSVEPEQSSETFIDGKIHFEGEHPPAVAVCRRVVTSLDRSVRD